MDFVSDALFDGWRFRILTVVDNFSRECLGVCVGQSIRGEQAVARIESGVGKVTLVVAVTLFG